MKNQFRLFNVIVVFAIVLSQLSLPFTQAAQAATSSLWPDPITPTFPYYNNPGSIEVGLKFRTDIAGYVTGVRYFKGTGSTGTRIGRLWSLDQTKLAEVTFTNETASGWQQALFPVPVAIQPNTTYIISYYVADGNRMLAISQNFFTSSGFTNGHLYALRNGEVGPNGVFSETGGFFNQGNLSSNYWVDLIFEDTPDTVPPTVSQVSPIAGATGVIASTNVTAIFNESMNVSSINTTNIQLYDSGNNLIPASVSFDQASRTAVLDPASNLSFNATYTALIKGDSTGQNNLGVKDFAGNFLASDFSWSFTIEALDTTPPVVSSVSPANAAPEVLISTNLSAIFSEAIDANTVNSTNFELRDPYNVLVPAVVAYDAGTNTAILDPAANLNYGTVYTARVKGGATGVKDLSQNALAVDYVWSFTTTTPPTVNSVSPTNGAIDVLISSDVSIVFSKAMDGNTINSTTFELRDPSNTLVPASFTYNSTTHTAVLNPGSNLSYSTIYTALVKGGSSGVKDLVSNPLASDQTWSFTTESMITTPPTVTSVKPINGVTRLRLATKATAYFSRAMDPNTINATTFELRDAANTLVLANVTYNPADNSAVLDPIDDLAYATTYTAKIISGPNGAKDTNGIPMGADYAWSFSTIAQRPAVDQAPGGPILIITSATNLFTRYFVEIIRTEGFNEFALADIGDVNVELLADYDLVILGDMALTTDQVNTLTDWVSAGGHLIAMRPDKKLAGLLGLADPGSTTLSDAYLLINTSSAPGAGIVGQTLQFHGTADQYTLNGATSLATLYSNATTATTYPAITVRSVGENGGQAAAFAFDLARSIVYTHQGNPAWQTGHVNPYQTYGTAVDLFAGIGGNPNWIDFTKITIPQADEQQRFLANLVLYLNRDEKPLPRFWYFPSGKKAAIILTGDDHIGRGNPSGSSAMFFDRHISQSPAGCSVVDWECVRSSSYGYVGNTISDATFAAYTAQGFEFGVHADAGLASGGGWCGTWPADMMAQYKAQSDALFDKYASLPVQSSERNHCYSWFGYTGPDGWVPYTSTPEADEAQGIRLDTNISYNPSGWATVNPGYQMGSGMLMRFAQVNRDGVMTKYMDIYNGGTQMNDDNGQGAAAMRTIVDSFLDAAIGPQGYYGAFVVNMHSDNWYGWSYAGSDQIVASAQARQIPVVSGSQMVEWLDGRNSSYFSNLVWAENALSFNINPAAGVRNLKAMLPSQFRGNPLSLLQQGGSTVPFTVETIKGVEYAIFDAQAGSYSATYTPDTYAPVITQLMADPSLGGNAEITWTTNEAATSQVDFGTSAGSLTLSATTLGLVTQHSVQLSGLLPNTTIYYRVTSSDESGNAAVSPGTGNPPASFNTPSAAFIDTTVSDFGYGTPDANLAISHVEDGEVMLKPVVYEEFNGTALPAGWDDFFGMSGTTGSVIVSGGKLTVDGANAGTTALYGPGHAVEFTATFTAGPNQHAGFGVNHTAVAGDAWAIFSTGQSGTQLIARSYNGTAPWDTVSTPITGSYFGAPHRYRVEWLADQVIYSIDGAVVTTHNVTIPIPMRPLVSEGSPGGASFNIDQLQMGPFPVSGVFTSRVMDSLGSVTNGTIAWDALTPAGTTLQLSLRTGNTPLPDSSWSPFVPVQNGDEIGSGFRYIQYQASFATTDTAVTPVLQEVRIPYNTIADSVAPQITSRTPTPGATNIYGDTDVSVTFNEPMQPASINASTFRLREVGGSVDIAADVSYSELTATLHPQAPLTPNRQYQVTVAGTVMDLSLNPLGGDDTWIFAVIQRPGPPWMNSSWKYRRAVTVTCPCDVAQADYQVKITLDNTFDFANAKSDGSDLRVTASDGTTAVPFWIESWDSVGHSASIWVKLATIPLEGVSIFLYYGNPAATELSNGGAVFSFFDGFSGTALDTSKWTIESGTPPVATFANGVMTLNTTSPYSKIKSVPAFGYGYMVEAFMRHPQATINGLISEVGFASTFPNSLRIVDDFPDTAHWQWVADAPGLNSGVNSMTQTTLNTGWNHYRVGRVAGMASFQVNAWLPSTTTSNLPTIDLPAFLMSYGTNNQAQVDWLFVRKWCGSDPSATVGNVEAFNTPPNAAGDAYSTAEDTVLTVAAPGVLGNDTDPNNDLLNALLVSGPAHGTLVLNADGSFVYTPDANYNGPDSFTYKANDGQADSNTATVTITVNPVNDAPVLDPIGPKTVNEEMLLSFTASASDQDIPAQTLTFSLVDVPAGASIDPDTGAFSWTPTEAQGPGAYTFNVCVSDSVADPVCETITATVNEVNVAPVLGAIEPKTINEMTGLTFTATATDPDLPANTLSFSLVGAPEGASITPGGAFSWTPTQAQGPGNYPFTVKVCDNGAPPLCDEETITVTVTNVLPTVTLDKRVDVEFLDEPGGDFIFTLLVTNTSAEAVTITALTDSQSGDASDFSACEALVGTTLAAGASTDCTYVVTHTDVAPEGGSYDNTANVTVRDNDGSSATAEDSQMVWVDDLRPTIRIEKSVDVATLPEPGGNFNFALKITNTSVEPVVITQLTDWNLSASFLHPYLGTWLQPGEILEIPYTVTHTDAMSYQNDASITVQDNEENYATATATKTVYVTDVKPSVTLVKTVDVPSLPAPGGLFHFTLTITNNSPETVWITELSDTNAAILSDECLLLVSDNPPYTDYGLIPAGESVSCNYDVTRTEVGSYDNTATITVMDNELNEASASASMSVAVTNVAPTLNGIGDKTVGEMTALTFTATATDPGAPPETLSFSLVGTPEGASITTSGDFNWTPTEAQGPGSYTFDVCVSDGALSDCETITVTVNEVNRPPVLGAIGDQAVAEITELTFTATATDPDVPANTLSFSLVGEPEGASITTGGAFTWTPTEAQGPGSYPFTVKVCDNGTPSLCDEEAITVTVSEVNVAPVLDPIGDQSVAEEMLLSFTATATDHDIPVQTLSFSLAGAPAGAGITTSGDFSWTPTEAQGPGSYTFDVCVSDGALSDCETITVTVSEVNVAPVLDPIGDQSVAEEMLLSFTATATDRDIPVQTLSFSLLGAPAGAGITTGGAFTWTPTEAQGPGSYPFTVKVCDNGTPSLCDEEAITVTVSEVNVAPVLDPIDDQSVAEEMLLSFTATATDRDIPVQTLSFSLLGAPAGAGITTGGDFSWTPTEAQGPGSYTFDVCVSDGALNDCETITVTVSEVNRDPVLGAIGNKTIDEMTALTFTATATDPDVPANTLSFSLVGEPEGASITTGGAFTWTPTEAQGPGSYPFTVKVCDNGTPSLCDEEAITVTVSEVNRDPVLGSIGNKTVLWGNELAFTATATDLDLPANTLAFSLVGAPSGASIDSSTGGFTWTPAEAQGPGSYTFTVKVCDNGTPSLCDEEIITVIVGKRPTMLVYSGASSGQYSDLAAVNATLTDNGGGDLQGTLLGSKSIAFNIGSQSASASTNTFGLAQTTIQLTQQASTPGVTSTFAGDGLYLGSGDSDAFQVYQENAYISYTGDSLGRTGANLTLQATVWDSAAAGYLGDNSESGSSATFGDITKMWIAFNIYPAGSCGSGTPTVRYSRVTDTGILGDGIGTATATFTSTSESSYCVVSEVVAASGGGVNLWYVADLAESAGIAFYDNTGQFATGGGWVMDPNGKKGNFGFNARYNKKGAPQGQMVYVYRGYYNGVLADFIIKSNALGALSFSGTQYPIQATLQGKCNLQINRAGDGVQLWSDGNATFVARIIDSNLSSGIGNDSFELSVWDKNGVPYKMVPKTLLSGGNVVVHSR